MESFHALLMFALAIAAVVIPVALFVLLVAAMLGPL